MFGTGVIRRRRHTTLSAMLATAVRTGSYEAPWRAMPEVFEVFTDEADVLRELQRQWRTALAGAVYVAIEQGRGDLTHDVTTAYRSVVRRHPGLRPVLQAHADHPAIAAAMRKERALLASFTDLWTDSPHAA